MDSQATRACSLNRLSSSSVYRNGPQQEDGPPQQKSSFPPGFPFNKGDKGTLEETHLSTEINSGHLLAP